MQLAQLFFIVLKIISFHPQNAYQTFNLKTPIRKLLSLQLKEKRQPGLSFGTTSNLHLLSNIRHRAENSREVQGGSLICRAC